MKGMTGGELGLGLIGCGGFGLFATQHFVQEPGVSLIGVTDTVPEAAAAAARGFDVPDLGGTEQLLSSDAVDIVYIATPPFLHHPQAMEALAAGKHVICEKPLALNVEQGQEMIAEAERRDRLMVVDLMQRYNPLYDAVAGLIASGVLGEALHGSFENLASDESLPAGHWFWDRASSGGIFVEHGVHFFDMFAGWLGPGRVDAARAGTRPGTDIEEQVGCSVRYGESMWVDFYHGFTQARRLDRQQLRIVFEHGDITLLGWVPTKAHVHALVDEGQARELSELFPGARLDVAARYGGTERAYRSRGKDLEAYELVDVSQGDGDLKMRRYGELLRAIFADQVAWIRDRDHRRRITEHNGLDSLVTACAADELARRETAMG